ncbi:MAG: imidazole glycerol phosphate synthase subunit HisH [Omnitrophica bacterium]|nr:imidazole glycerol phosphate synthase subunit HisH [Candidatus Omnitrophota bacterium]
MKVTVIDYGLGNLASVYNALTFLGVDAKVSALPQDIDKADKLVLPGVGAFGNAMAGLHKRGLIEPIKNFLTSGKAYLGICLGLQLLFEQSEEGGVKGLGIFKGEVKRFQAASGIKVPHIGWNTVKLKADSSKLTADIKDGSYFYFDHSYYASPEDTGAIAANTEYGINFASMIRRDNVYAVQFHPERSQKLGLKFLENFIKL